MKKNTSMNRHQWCERAPREQMEEQVLYRKTVTPGGRVRYCPTHLPSYEGIGKGAYLYVVDENLRSRVKVLNPAKAELLAASQLMHREMLTTMVEACRLQPNKSYMGEDEQAAWEAYAAEMRKRGKDPRPLTFSGVSMADVISAGIAVLVEDK